MSRKGETARPSQLMSDDRGEGQLLQFDRVELSHVVTEARRTKGKFSKTDAVRPSHGYPASSDMRKDDCWGRWCGTAGADSASPELCPNGPSDRPEEGLGRFAFLSNARLFQCQKIGLQIASYALNSFEDHEREIAFQCIGGFPGLILGCKMQ